MATSHENNRYICIVLVCQLFFRVIYILARLAVSDPPLVVLLSRTILLNAKRYLI